MTDTHPPDPRAIEALLAFWRDAGVDACFEEYPVDRLARPSASLETARAVGRAAAAPLKGDRPAPGEAVVRARQIAAETATLADLRAAVEAFDGCGLRFAGASRQAVFARGAHDAPLMVIGEAPGAEEDARGEPFVGPAGRMLDRMLSAAGLLDKSFITNVVFWRPPANRNPSIEECAVCSPFLERAIEILKPRAILLLGGAAAKAVLGREEGILSMRGKWFDHVSPQTARVTPAMATLHPAFLLRQPAAKKLAWRDLLAAAERVDRSETTPA